MKIKTEYAYFAKLPFFAAAIIVYQFFLAGTTFSASQFDTEYDIVYEVDANGETRVTQEISVINNRSDVIPSTYSFTIRQLDIYDIEGEDNEGSLKLEVKKDSGETNIKTKLNDPAIGMGRENTIQISYKSKQIATKTGDIWNMYIPQIYGLDKIRKYNILISIPKELGPKIFISPTPIKESEENNNYLFEFDKDSIKGKSISASLGKYQSLNYKLNYTLQNDSLLWRTHQITLPPDIAGRQQVLYKSLTPPPREILTDKDGNILANYKLKPKQTLTVELIGSSRLLGKQIQPGLSGKMDSIPKELVKTYTKEDKYWEVNAVEIQELARSLYKEDATVAQNARAVYDYIVKNLEYNFEATEKTFIERNGALAALKRKEPWACMEFTDLFIALSRAMGIPARELNGYAMAKDSNTTPLSINFKSGDLLHAWPEFYDPNFGWVAIDPTWGNTSGIDYFTKLDTNHFVFSIKGLDSEYPLPAGAFRLGDEKQVEVDYAQNLAESAFDGEVEIKQIINLNPIKLLLGEKLYNIKNTGGTFLYGINGGKEDLKPFGTLNIYLPKDKYTVKYFDFNGSEKTFSF